MSSRGNNNQGMNVFDAATAACDLVADACNYIGFAFVGAATRLATAGNAPYLTVAGLLASAFGSATLGFMYPNGNSGNVKASINIAQLLAGWLLVYWFLPPDANIFYMFGNVGAPVVSSAMK